jgi:tyrosine-protein phosphatase SIW14
LRFSPVQVRAWSFGLAIAVLLTAVPIVYYRMRYAEQKRLRVVTAGKLYRSGCMMAQGFEDAVREFKIRTVVNLMEEAPDPDLPVHYFSTETEKESDICRRLGVRYVNMHVDLAPPPYLHKQRPALIERWLELLDDKSNYPILLHCKAGLHRTGVLVGIYRMEYEGWSRAQALAEIRHNGYDCTTGFKSTAANQYINQYILHYVPNVRPGRVVERVPAPRSVPGSLTSRPSLSPGAYQKLPRGEESDQ